MEESLKQSTVLPESMMAEAHIQPVAGLGKPWPGEVSGCAGSRSACGGANTSERCGGGTAPAAYFLLLI
jgi:hypothetical protein